MMRRRWRAWRSAMLLALAPRAISAVLWIVGRTVRIDYRHMEELFDCWRRGERVIVAFWHHRVALMPVAYRGRGMCILNSQSRDGEIASRALDRWHIRSVRGSATRGGVGGFLQLVDAYRDGYDLAVVPDGPRGPACQAKPGVVHLAKATGARIFPIAYAAERHLRLRSWDRLIIPLPFSRVVFLAGETMAVDRGADESEMERARVHLEDQLNSVCAAADRAVGSA